MDDLALLCKRLAPCSFLFNVRYCDWIALDTHRSIALPSFLPFECSSAPATLPIRYNITPNVSRRPRHDKSCGNDIMADQTINIPQLVIILVLGGLAVRWFFFSTSSGASQNRGSNSANNIRAREADVERIQQMFPQVARRSIMWDLQRNGGNVVATTERILSGRGLEVVR